MNLSKERLLDELKKYTKYKVLTKLSKDKLSLELFNIIFPEIKMIKHFTKLNTFAEKRVEEADFIFLLSLLIRSLIFDDISWFWVKEKSSW